MFTRKHYRAIAEIINRRFTDLADNACGMAVQSNIEIVIEDLACYFERDNLNFDRDKFIAACSD